MKPQAQLLKHQSWYLHQNHLQKLFPRLRSSPKSWLYQISHRDLQQTRESNKSTICAHKFQAHQLKFGTTPSRTTTRFKDTPSVKFLKFSLNCSPLSLSHWPWIEPPNPWNVYHGYKSTLHQVIWIYCWISIGWLSLPPLHTTIHHSLLQELILAFLPKAKHLLQATAGLFGCILQGIWFSFILSSSSFWDW